MTDKITIERETLQSAIDALEGTDLGHYYATIDALRAALAAQPAEQTAQEPVAWKHDCAGLCTNGVELWIDACPHCGKPRTAPPAPAAVPLTDERIDELWREVTAESLHSSRERFAREIERAHGIAAAGENQ